MTHRETQPDGSVVEFAEPTAPTLPPEPVIGEAVAPSNATPAALRRPSAGRTSTPVSARTPQKAVSARPVTNSQKHSRKQPETRKTPAPAAAQDEPPAERELPHDSTFEASVLGSMIIDPDTIAPVRVFLRKPEMFYDDAHEVLFRAICQIVDDDKPLDGVILHRHLAANRLLEQVGGLDYLRKLVENVPTTANAERYALEVYELWRRREFIAAKSHALSSAYNDPAPIAEIIERDEAETYRVLTDEPGAGTVETIPQVLPEVLEAMEKRQDATALPTGWPEVDQILRGGLHRGEMVVIAARPSVGKTSFLTNMCEYQTIQARRRIAMFSLEMSRQELIQRMICSRSGVPSERFVHANHLRTEERDAFGRAVSELTCAAGFYLNSSPQLNLAMLRSQVRRLKQHHGIEMFAVDYLQLMDSGTRAKGENRTAELAVMTRGLKMLAMDLGVSAVILSQLNRECEREDRRPRTSDLRESGSIEQDADVVILLHREAVMHRGDQEWMSQHPELLHQAEVIVAKQRNGPTDVVKLTFADGTTRFNSIQPGLY